MWWVVFGWYDGFHALFVDEYFCYGLDFIELVFIGYGPDDFYFHGPHLLCARLVLACIYVSLMWYKGFDFFKKKRKKIVWLDLEDGADEWSVVEELFDAWVSFEEVLEEELEPGRAVVVGFWEGDGEGI